MQHLSGQLTTKLLGLNHRTLVMGEIYLLSKVISDMLPIPERGETSIAMYTLTHKQFINDVLFALDTYSYLDEETKDTIISLIQKNLLWRMTVAYEPSRPTFSGKAECIVDELSGLLKYMDHAYISATMDIAENANYIYCLFHDLVSEVKSNFRKD